MQCGHNSCRHELQERLAALNPALTERVRRISSASPGISSRAAYERALRAGTAADGNKVAGAQAEKVRQAGDAGRARGDGPLRMLVQLCLALFLVHSRCLCTVCGVVGTGQVPVVRPDGDVELVDAGEACSGFGC